MIERTYLEPVDLDQARSMLAEHGGARIVAGGTDLVVGARSGKAPLPHDLIAIHRVKELAGLEHEAGGGLRIGALMTSGFTRRLCASAAARWWPCSSAWNWAKVRGKIWRRKIKKPLVGLPQR